MRGILRTRVGGRRRRASSSVVAVLTALLMSATVAVPQPAGAATARHTVAPRAIGGSHEAGEPTAWSITDHPKPSASSDSWFNNATCVSAKFCVAVGAFVDIYGDDEGLVETYDGTAWTNDLTPRLLGVQLDGVACMSSSLCVAVGILYGSIRQTFIETWNGSTWTTDTSPNPSSVDDELYWASCTTTACVVVGQQETSSHVYQTLVERSTDGTDWTVENSQNTSSSQNDYLNAVSCLPSSFCMAVGGFYNGHTQTFSEDSTDGGQTWTLQTPADTSASQNNDLYGVSCTSSSTCWAVGDNNSTKGVLAESWNGTSWTLPASQPISPSGTYNDLYSIICSSATSCVAVGDESDGHNGQTLAETLSGSAWTVSTTTDPSGLDNDNFLYGIGCWSSGCVAAGEYYNGTTWLTLAEANTGSGWTTTTSDNASGSYFDGTSCLASPTGWCMAVGTFTGGDTTVDETLAEASSGGTWSSSPAENVPGASYSYLQAVSCTSSSFCVAVGAYYSSANGNDQTLAETYDGSAWTISYPQNPGSAPHSNDLVGVSCWSAEDCAAVGDYYDSSGDEQTVAEYTTDGGASWTQGTSASPDEESWLSGVSCSAAECEAVGADWNGSVDQTLIEVSTDGGATWTQQTSPDTSVTQNNYLNGVSCSATSPSTCVAVGDYYNGSAYQAIAEYSSAGSSWTIADASNSFPASHLYGVSCTSSVDCVAAGAGSYLTAGKSDQTLVEYSTDGGKDWTQVSSPNASTYRNGLEALSCASFTACVAVGAATITPDNDQALIETGTAPAPTPSKLAFTKQPPAKVKHGVKFTVKVSVEYSSGKVDTASNASVTLALSGGAKDAKLACKANPVKATKGVATFSCSVSKAGTGYKVTATSHGLTKATSKVFKATS